MRGSATAKIKSIQAKQLIQRSQYLRAHSGFLSRAAFNQRKEFFCDKEKGAFCQKVDPSLNPQQQMMSDPSMLSDMLTKNLTMVVPQVSEATKPKVRTLLIADEPPVTILAIPSHEDRDGSLGQLLLQRLCGGQGPCAYDAMQRGGNHCVAV